MVVPYRHVAGLEDLDEAESAELMSVTRTALRALRAVSAPHAFNVGLNLGTVAGGSLADHLHQHVVPRWGGDANFIAVIGQTKVIPQLLSETRRCSPRPGRMRRGKRPTRAGAPGRHRSPSPSQGRTVAGTDAGLPWNSPPHGTEQESMLNLFARAHVSRVTDPDRAVAGGPRRLPGRGHGRRHRRHRGRRRRGSSRAASCSSARCLATVFVLFDMIDGAMARARGHSTPFGAVLDSTCDRHRRRRAVRRDRLVVPGQRAGRARRRRADLPGRRPGHLLHQGARRGGRADRRRRPGRAARAADRVAGRRRASRVWASRTRWPPALWLLAAASVWTVGQRIVAVHRSAREVAEAETRGTAT